MNMSKLEKSPTLLSETFREEMASDEHIQQLLTLLKKAKDDEVRDNICSVLVNLALDEETGEKIGKSHGIKELLSILSVSNSKEVQKSACTALWNLSSVDSNKDQFDSLAIEQLLTILKQASEKKNNEELQADLCGLFQNLALKDNLRGELNRLSSAKSLVPLLSHKHLSLLKNATGVLLNLSQDEKTYDEMSDCGIVKLLLPLLTHTNEDVLENALGISWNISLSDPVKKQMIESGAVDVIAHWSDHPTETLRNYCHGALEVLSQP
eukprot:TRINITY_DN3943_c0_g2_i2.p1 TRINITY_DN3943_c0_g2~~TRINITY_DN3943_c0_g2_i2.p1  ORF type:complete len:267 (-),score=74.09 TRINITY_DN3943_c0_g2_i2:117-917(-)